MDETTTEEPAVLIAAAPPAIVVSIGEQQFTVAAGTATETIRNQLVLAGFADAAGADVTEATVEIRGVAHPLLPFVKRAGTKG